MKATSLFISCALLFTVLTSEKGCQDQSATAGKTGTTTNGGTRTGNHAGRVPINSTIGLLLAAGVGLGAVTILKRNQRNIAQQG